MGRADEHGAQKSEEPGDKGRPAAGAEQRKKSSGGNRNQRRKPKTGNRDSSAWRLQLTRERFAVPL
jgi:hypothetical protein